MPKTVRQVPHFRARAFTLAEMVVAIAILLVIILAVGVIFQAAGRTVGLSQSSMEMLSNNRAIQQQLTKDVGGIDKDAFLVIRCIPFTDGTTSSRADLISFVSLGSFVHRTGTSNATPFTDNNTVAPAAVVTWGQLAMEKTSGPRPANSTDSLGYLVPVQTAKLMLTQVPTGVVQDPATGKFNDGGLTLGRNAMLLVPQSAAGVYMTPSGDSVAAYTDVTGASLGISLETTAVLANSTFDTSAADITQSRLDVAATTVPAIMSFLRTAVGAHAPGLNLRYEADHFCFRHAALTSPYDGANLVNGYFRMHPIALQGATSFAVDWTDGSVYTGGEIDVVSGKAVNSGDPVTGVLMGTTKWYGMYNTSSGLARIAAFANGLVDVPGVVGASGGGSSGDVYCAIFSFDTPRTSWPVALRFRYHLADPSGRVTNGRDFSQVVKLPN